MKRLFFLLICINWLILGFFEPLGALEIELIGGANNATFNPDRITSHGQSVNEKQFDGYPFIYGDLFVRGLIYENLRYEAHFQRDNIMLNCLSGKLLTNLEYFNIGFGPFVGMSDNLEKPDIGITGEIDFSIPGIIFVTLNGTSTLVAGAEILGENERESVEAKVGFWLPSLVISLTAGTKTYTKYPEISLILRDSLTRFMLSVDFHTKNSPVYLRLDGGYQILTRSYILGNTETIDELKSAFAGIEVRWQALKQMQVTAGFEIPLFLYPTAPLELPVGVFGLYKFSAGVSYTFF